MKKLLFMYIVYSSVLYAGHIEWKEITVNHFWTIFDDMKIGDTVDARLIGAEKGTYQLKNRISTGIAEYDYYFFIPHPGPGHPIRVTTHQTMYGKRPVSESVSEASKELKGDIAGSLYNQIKIHSAITIQGTKYTVVDHYEGIGNNSIFILQNDEGSQKKLILKHKDDVGHVCLACEDSNNEELLVEEDTFVHRCGKTTFSLLHYFYKKLF